MEFERVRELTEGIPFIKVENARRLYDLVLQDELEDCLELGFAHGVGSCYIAAALDELGRGHLTSVDLVSAQPWQQPSIEELLERCGLRDRVTVVREHTGYNWFLRTLLREHTVDGVCAPSFDLCIIDGPKHWTIDGFAFFLADKLLRPNAAIVFDDVDYTYATWHDEHGDAPLDGVNGTTMSHDELHTPHVREIAELLVMPHPDYERFTFTDTDWFIARKRATSAAPAQKTIQYEVLVRPADVVRRQMRDAARRSRRAISAMRRRRLQHDASGSA